MVLIIWFGLLVIGQISNVESANILFLTGLPSPSHQIWNREITNALASRGHNLTVISTDIDAKPPKNVHYLLLEGIYNDYHTEFRKTIFDYRVVNKPWQESKLTDDSCYIVCELLVKTDGYNKLLAYPDDYKFDLILYDYTCGPCLLSFLHKFNYPPLIAVSAYSLPSFTNALIGGHQYYSYIPHNTLLIEGEMNILNRAYNMLLYSIEALYRKYVFIPKLNKLSAGIFGQDLPSMTDLEERTILALVSINAAMDAAEPLSPNVIPIGGLHIKDPKPLPRYIETFINASKKGAVIFSLGTNIQCDLMDSAKQTEILKAFRQLPDYYFLWKFESNMSASEIPKNVLLEKWLPQSDILAHPKVKALFTHSGLLSTQEAIWRGVPMLGLPFMFDQHKNILKSKKLGIGEMVSYDTLNAAEIKEKLQKILEDPSYITKAKEISKSFRDQKEKPLDRAIWWIEWVLRNPNPDYLKSPVLKLGFIRGNSYDIVVLVTLALVLLVTIVWKTCALMKLKLWNSKSTNSKIEKKRN